MKATGIVRKVDELGRLVIPIEIRRSLRIAEGDPIEIFTENDTIVLKKYNPGCIFSGDMKGLIDYKGVKVSVEAIKEMARMAGL